MSFYHVLASFDPNGEDVQSVFSNLSEQELLERFVQHYREGSDVVVGNEILPITRIRKLFIVRTDEFEEIVRAQINERSLREISKLNDSSDQLVILSGGRGYDPEDLLEDGEDVTAEFIGGAPGYRKAMSPVSKAPTTRLSHWRLRTLINHPWIVSIGGGLLVAAIVALLALVL